MGVIKRRWDHPVVVRRFLAFLKPCPNCMCVLFTGALTNGWGRFVAHEFPGCPSGRAQAHRYALAIFRGIITPPGWQAHHSYTECNHRNCCNAYHIEPISPEDHGQISSDHKAALRKHDGDAAEDFFG